MTGRGFESIVFSGGGCRCFWQAGFWKAAAPRLELRPKVVAAVSAGAAFACAALGGVVEQVVEDFITRARDNRRNFYPQNLLAGRRAFPHEDLYRDAILSSIDACVLEKLRQGPELRVLVARPPLPFATHTQLLVALMAYKADRLARRRVHVTWPARLGFHPIVASVGDCRTPTDLADLILQSSTTPPVTKLQRRNGRVVVDGGIIDSVPVALADPAHQQLVLLTRRYPSLPRVEGRVYVQPSRPLSISTWDYTRPELIREAYELGQRDGERFAKGRLD